MVLKVGERSNSQLGYIGHLKGSSLMGKESLLVMRNEMSYPRFKKKMEKKEDNICTFYCIYFELLYQQ